MGSVKKIDRKKPWRARYRGPDGREHSRTFRTQKMAERWLKVEEAKAVRGEWVDTSRTVTVSDWFPSWLDAKRRISDRTRDDYREIWHNRIEPTFGRMALPRVTRDHVSEWVEGMVRDGLSPVRIRKCHMVLAAMLDGAADEMLIGRNPARRIELPRLEESEHRYLTAEEVERLAIAMVEEHRAMVYVLAYGGLRFGEAQALRVEDCDILHNRLRIRRAVEMVTEDDGKRRPRIKDTTKTYKRRTVQLPGFVSDHLARHLSEYVTEKPEAFVFAAPEGGVLDYSHYRRRMWNPARDAAELDDVTPHDLRHTCAALMRAEGATVEKVSQQLGHRSPVVTLSVYSHLFEGALDDVMARLDAAGRSASARGTDAAQEVTDLDEAREQTRSERGKR